jgi:hypothetical protein
VNNLTGKKFNRLKVLHQALPRQNGHIKWVCKCQCGNITEVVGSKLLDNSIKSCGCWNSEVASIKIKTLMKRRGGFRGENNPRWRSDWTDEERQLRKEIRNLADPKKKKWRQKVYARNRYVCQKCQKSKPGELTAHHIYSWTSHPTLRYTSSNGITFCLKCHINFHRKYGYGKNTRKQLNDYL